MNIKSLLLGSAAALVAVSGAQAADAIVVEPEPVEYVRICDMYGTGFYYIPGTETCMRWNGYFRATYSHVNDPANSATDEHRMRWRHRARIHLDTRNETDWGTLRGWVRIQSNATPASTNAGGFAADKFMISFSNENSTLRVAELDHFFITNHGYAGVFAWDVLSGAHSSDGGLYGNGETAHQLDYTYAVDGFAITVGISSDTGFNGTNSSSTNTSVIDAYAGINYRADWGGFAATYLHEGENTTLGSSTGAWKVSADLDLSEFIPGGNLHGMYASTDDNGGTYVAGSGISTGARDNWQVSFQMDLSDDLAMFAQYSAVDYDLDTTGDLTSWSAGVQWRPVTGFRAYAAYVDTEQDGGIDSNGFTFGVRRDF